MKKLFIHQPLFRIFSPIFSGIIVYFLVLLINNNVAQIQEEFLGEDLYAMIGLSYLIQESIRILLWMLRRKRIKPNDRFEIGIQIALSIVLCIMEVSIAMTIFYDYVIGFSINFQELLVFNSIFVVISLIYVLLFISHQYLYKVNEEKLRHEELIRQNIEDEFLQFKRAVNPELLFDSLESLLTLLEKNHEDIEDFIDHLALLYRYILSKKEKQLVSYDEELEIAGNLISLIDKLPLHDLRLKSKVSSDFLIVPGTLLELIEQISRSSLISSNKLTLLVTEDQDSFSLSYKKNDRIVQVFDEDNMTNLRSVYNIYSEGKISVEEKDDHRVITIPKLTLA